LHFQLTFALGSDEHIKYPLFKPLVSLSSCLGWMNIYQKNKCRVTPPFPVLQSATSGLPHIFQEPTAFPEHSNLLVFLRLQHHSVRSLAFALRPDEHISKYSCEK